MRVFRKVLLSLSILLSVLIAVLTMSNAFFSYYIIFDNIPSELLLSVLFLILTLTFIVHLILVTRKRNITSVFSIVLLTITLIIVIFLGLSPKYRYTTLESTDGKHNVLVQEKLVDGIVSVQVYEQINYPIYKAMGGATLGKEESKKYEYGDYEITFRDYYIDFHLPLYSEPDMKLYYSK